MFYLETFLVSEGTYTKHEEWDNQDLLVHIMDTCDKVSAISVCLSVCLSVCCLSVYHSKPAHSTSLLFLSLSITLHPLTFLHLLSLPLSLPLSLILPLSLHTHTQTHTYTRAHAHTLTHTQNPQNTKHTRIHKQIKTQIQTGTDNRPKAHNEDTYTTGLFIALYTTVRGLSEGESRRILTPLVYL